MEQNQNIVRFGLLADPHYAEREMMINRYYERSLDKIRSAVETFNAGNLDFVVCLGDLKDSGNPPVKQESLRFLDAAEAELQKFRGAVYHVLGNHDIDSGVSKNEFFDHAKNPPDVQGRTFYSFTVKGVKFIALDANFNPGGAPRDAGGSDWRLAFIPREEIEWLKKELEEDRPAIILVHHLLDYFSAGAYDHYAQNAAEIVKLLESSNRVPAVFQGHYHKGYYSVRRGIHYITLKSMAEGLNTSYAVAEINAAAGVTVTGYGDCESRIITE